MLIIISALAIFTVLAVAMFVFIKLWQDGLDRKMLAECRRKEAAMFAQWEANDAMLDEFWKATIARIEDHQRNNAWFYEI